MQKKKKENQNTPDNIQDGRVIISQRSDAVIEDNNGNIVLCKRKKGLGRTVCGDFVLWYPTNDSQGIIHSIIPRKTELSRPDSRGKIKTIASNIDQIIIVSAPIPEIQFELIDRYIVAATLLNIPPVVVLNKRDLLNETTQQHIEDGLKTYSDIGIKTIFTSTITKDGLNEIDDTLANNTSILVGQSGVGKSSIIQTLLPQNDIRIGAISDYSGEGRHTTTETTLYHLSNSGYIIDSPGVRAFRLWNLSEDEVAKGFLEFAPYLDQCKFSNCRHIKEPGCKIKEAASTGAISECRLKSYYNILKSLEKQY